MHNIFFRIASMATFKNRQFSFTICFCFCVNDVAVVALRRRHGVLRHRRRGVKWWSWCGNLPCPPQILSVLQNRCWEKFERSFCLFIIDLRGLGILTFWRLLTSVRGGEDVLRVPLQVHYHRRHGWVPAANIRLRNVLIGEQKGNLFKVVEGFF